jgi:telomere length regulation protein
VKELYLNLLDEQDFSTKWGAFFDCLRLQEQKTILESIFRDIEKRYFSKDEGIENGASDIIGDLAIMFSFIINGRAPLELQIQSWLATGQGGLIQSIGLRRSLLLLFSNNEGKLLPCIVS